MLRWLSTWPPAVWLLVYIASLLVLMGSQRWDLGVVGAALLLIAFGLAVYLAVRPEPGLPRPHSYPLVLGGLAAFYLISAIAASKLGTDYAIVALLAGTIPTTAATLTYATARRKTRCEDGRLVDISAEDDSPFPGVGFDDRTPLGDSPERHDDVIEHDLPPGHPARRLRDSKAGSRGGIARDG